jgi:hypothetical protein
MPTNYPTTGAGFILARPVDSVVVRNDLHAGGRDNSTIPDGHFIRMTLPTSLFNNQGIDSDSIIKMSIQLDEQGTSYSTTVCFLQIVDNEVNGNGIHPLMPATGSSAAHYLVWPKSGTSSLGHPTPMNNAVISRRALIVWMRSSLHIALTHIAGTLPAPRTYGALSFYPTTANAMGSEYLRLCQHWGLTPYRSQAQVRASVRATGRTTVREVDEDMNALPSWLDAESTAWFNSLGYSFGHEIELLGLSVNGAHNLITQMPDIEVYSSTNYGHANFAQWKVVPDGTVSSGAEVVSPPMRLAEGFMTVRRVMLSLKRAGARITRACGGHVHFGVEHLTPSDRARIIEAHQRYQPLFDSFTHISRVNTRWTHHRSRTSADMYAEHFYTRAGNQGTDASGDTCSRGEVGSVDRYYSLNIASWVKYGTFENRQLEGCLNPKKMFAWLCLNQAFFKACEQPELFEPLNSTMMFLLQNGNSPQQLLTNIAVESNMPNQVKELIASFLRN